MAGPHPHDQAPGQPPLHDHGTLTRNAALASVASALLLLVLKGWAAWRTGSVALLGSLADTGLDLAASLVTLLAVRYAAAPPDGEHRFGHGKAEALAALFQVMLIAASAVGIFWSAAQRLMVGSATVAPEYGIGVSLVAMALTGALVAYQRHVLARTRSIAIATDSLHYQSDFALNGAVIASLAIEASTGIGWIDPLFGIAIALWLARGAWQGASGAIDQLMDRAWPDEKRQRFVAAARAHPELVTLHDLRTRSSGARDFVQFHVAMDPHLTLAQVHDVIERVEKSLGAQFPGTEIFIHVDPEGTVDEPGNMLAEADEFAALDEQQEGKNR